MLTSHNILIFEHHILKISMFLIAVIYYGAYTKC